MIYAINMLEPTNATSIPLEVTILHATVYNMYIVKLYSLKQLYCMILHYVCTILF